MGDAACYSHNMRARSGPFVGGIIKFAVHCPRTTLQPQERPGGGEERSTQTQRHTHTPSHPQHKGMLCTFPLIACFKQRLIVENYTLCFPSLLPPQTFSSFSLCLHIICVEGSNVQFQPKCVYFWLCVCACMWADVSTRLYLESTSGPIPSLLLWAFSSALYLGKKNRFPHILWMFKSVKGVFLVKTKNLVNIEELQQDNSLW